MRQLSRREVKSAHSRNFLSRERAKGINLFILLTKMKCKRSGETDKIINCYPSVLKISERGEISGGKFTIEKSNRVYPAFCGVKC